MYNSNNSFRERILKTSNGNKQAIFVEFIILFGLNYFLRSVMNADIFSIGIWIFFVLIIYVQKPTFLIDYCYILFLQTTNILGVFIIENGNIYLNELRCYSERHDSLLLIVFAHWIFFFALYSFDDTFGKNVYKKTERRKEIWMVGQDDVTKIVINVYGIGILLACCILFLHVIRTPAFSLGYDRFMYAQEYITGLWDVMGSVVSFSIPIMALIFSKSEKKLVIAIVCIYCLYLFWAGNKFGAFIDLLYLLLPALIKNDKLDEAQKYVKRNAHHMRQVVRYVVIAFMLVVGVVLFHNYLTGGRTIDMSVEYLEERAAQQGQLWWAMYEKADAFSLHIDELNDEFRTFFSLSDDATADYNYGIYKVMRMVTPSNVFTAKINSGSRYAAATYASIYYYFGIFGIIILAPVLALLFAVFLNWYKGSLEAGGLFECLISGKFLMVMHSVATQADFNVLFSWRSVFMMIFIIAWKNMFGVNIKMQQSRQKEKAKAIKSY